MMLDVTEVNKRFAASLRWHRLQQGKSRDELSGASGVCRRTIQNYEQGRTNPSLYNVILLADALRIPLAELANIEGGIKYAERG